MNILIVDGQGGGVGKQLTEGIKQEIPEAIITAVGTNAIASQTMLKAGANHVATGENAVIVAARTADIIAGPAGIVIADSLWGEITPAMAKAVAQSNAWRILVPMNLCKNYIAGSEKMPVSKLISLCVSQIKAIYKETT